MVDLTLVEERLGIIEENVLKNCENICNEVRERAFNEKHHFIQLYECFKYRDLAAIKSIFENCSVVVPFDKEDIRFMQFGKNSSKVILN